MSNGSDTKTSDELGDSEFVMPNSVSASEACIRRKGEGWALANGYARAAELGHEKALLALKRTGM